MLRHSLLPIIAAMGLLVVHPASATDQAITEAVGRAVQPCWQPPLNPQSTAVVRLRIAPDGTLLGEAIIDQGGKDTGAFAESALRAVRACAPYPSVGGLINDDTIEIRVTFSLAGFSAAREERAAPDIVEGIGSVLFPERASADDVQLIEFFAGEGCAIGPTTRKRAIENGFEAAEVDALADTALAGKKSIKTGEWIVLPASSCKISPPQGRSELQLSDPEIASRISAIDQYSDQGDPGCFLNADELYKELAVTRGWSMDKANQEYLRLLSDNLASGALRFYSEDPLSTPPGLQLTEGECANVPSIDQIRRSHKTLVDNFDAFIRADMGNVICGKNHAPSGNARQIYEDIVGGEASNAWMDTEVRFIAMGAGWVEGISMDDRGTPRPPLCVYE